MKVERTVFHIETEEEKELLLSILAKEILNNAKVEEDFQQTPLAELNEIPQYIPRPDDDQSDLMTQVVVQPKEEVVEEDDDEKESIGPVGQLIRLMTGIKDKNSVNHETPLYAREVQDPRSHSIEEIDPVIRFGDSYGRVVEVPESLVEYIRNK